MKGGPSSDHPAKGQPAQAAGATRLERQKDVVRKQLSHVNGRPVSCGRSLDLSVRSGLEMETQATKGVVTGPAGSGWLRATSIPTGILVL